jgi:hypothetical protein
MAYTTIDNPELYFQCKKWAGNNSGSGISITLDGDENMQPDLVWVKSTDNTHSHVIYDSVRTSPAKYFLKSDDSIAERTAAIGSFDSDGVTFSDNDGFYNGSDNYVGWFWKAGTTSGLSGGTITPTSYSINTTSGFGIYSYNGNATSGATIAHGLSSVPKMIIIKRRNGTNAWHIFHTVLGNTKWIEFSNQTPQTGTSRWNDTSPTSSLITLGNDNDVNSNTNPFIAYLWTEKQGFSKFGSYTGNGNADGTFVYLGFRPAYVMVKRTSSTAHWQIQDNKRQGFNPENERIYANDNSSEQTINFIDLLSNGFKCITTDAGANGSGDTYIYMAFAEAPFVNSNGVPNNAR